MEFSIAKMKDTIKTQTDKKVSKDSAEKFGKLLEQYGQEIAEAALKHAKSSGRQTVRAEDVKHAVSQYRRLDVQVNRN